MRDEALPEAEKDGEMLKVGRMAKPGLLTWNPKIDWFVDVCSFFKGAFLRFQPFVFGRVYRHFWARTRFGEQILIMYMDMFIWVNSSYISRCFSLI